MNLGREELYELVWSEPMVRLARRFAVTDVGLAKTCKRMGIPVPPRGYWRRKETGYRVGRPALRRGSSTLLREGQGPGPAVAGGRQQDIDADILHAFEKRTRRTVKDDLDLARQRLRLLLNQRARRKG